MKRTKSPSTKTPTGGSSTGFLDWKSKDYGLGPEPPRGSLEWMEWIEDQALLAGADAAAQKLNKQKTEQGG